MILDDTEFSRGFFSYLHNEELPGEIYVLVFLCILYISSFNVALS